MKLNNKQGFTLIEVILVIGILSVLFTIASIGLPRARNNIPLDTAVSNLSSELKSQQIKAMHGDTEGSGITSAYGVHFENSKFTLFPGNSYSPTGPSNIDIELSQGLSFASSQTIVFSEKSGELFEGSPVQIIIQDEVLSRQKTITINRLGIITSISN